MHLKSLLTLILAESSVTMISFLGLSLSRPFYLLINNSAIFCSSTISKDTICISGTTKLTKIMGRWCTIDKGVLLSSTWQKWTWPLTQNLQQWQGGFGSTPTLSPADVSFLKNISRPLISQLSHLRHPFFLFSNKNYYAVRNAGCARSTNTYF